MIFSVRFLPMSATQGKHGQALPGEIDERGP